MQKNKNSDKKKRDQRNRRLWLGAIGVIIPIGFGILVLLNTTEQTTISISGTTASTAVEFPTETLTPEDLGDTYLRNGQWLAAVDAYTAELEQDPQNADAYLGRGIAYSLLGDTDFAIANFQRAVDASPDNADAWYRLANVVYDVASQQNNTAQFTTALTYAQEAITQYDQAGQRPPPELYLLLGDIQYDLGAGRAAQDAYALYLESVQVTPAARVLERVGG